MSFPNLSALAVRERAVTLFFILLSVAADALLMRRLIAARRAREHAMAEQRIQREIDAQQGRAAS